MLISSVISKARDKIKSFYGFTESTTEVRKAVEWLIKDAHFIFGSVDVKVGSLYVKLFVSLISNDRRRHSTRKSLLALSL